jgi:hypothetical protein
MSGWPPFQDRGGRAAFCLRRRPHLSAEQEQLIISIDFKGVIGGFPRDV